MNSSPLIQNEIASKSNFPASMFEIGRRGDSIIHAGGRFVDRSAPSNQSKGIFNIDRNNIPNANELYRKDWVHTLLHRQSYQLALLLFIVYVVSFIFFTPFWWALSDRCGLDFGSIYEAFIFTVYTITTVGYGVRTDYMDGCLDGAMLLTLQQVFAMILNAIILGGFWLRISRPDARAATIAFSDKAVVQEIRGKLYLMFQVAELRKHQLVEAHVRCYCLRSRPGFAAASMRLTRPDDMAGGYVLLCFPVVVVHRIDNWSPLNPPQTAQAQALPPPSSSSSPPPQRSTDNGDLLGSAGKGCPPLLAHNPSADYLFPDIAQREADVESGEREEKTAATAVAEEKSGEAAAVAAAAGWGGAAAGKHSRLEADAEEEDGKLLARRRKKEAVMAWLEESGSEVLALVEGQENMTGCSLQARHSYTVDDMVFDKTFAPCVTAKEGGGCIIDFAKFQELIDVPRGNGEFCSHA